jgi:hypothetical protein
VLDSRYSSAIEQVFVLWKRFRLFRDGELVYRFTYRDPQGRLSSLLAAWANEDDWWDWDTPFDFVHKRLGRTARR